MDKEFVTYERAVTLKELGFNEPCICFYDEDGYLFSVREQDDIYDYWTPAPSYSQVFRWFREKHKLHSYIEGAYPWFRYYINSEDDRFEGHKHSLFEEAESACLDKLIEIVKNI